MVGAHGVIKAGFLCGLSQLSMPIGAVIGVAMSPVSEKVTARWMAFGAGALVFAVATDLFGEALGSLNRAAHDEDGCGPKCTLQFWKLIAQVVMSIVGCMIFLKLNRLLEAFARSTAAKGGLRELELPVAHLSVEDGRSGTTGLGKLHPHNSEGTEEDVAIPRGPSAAGASALSCPIAALAPLRQASVGGPPGSAGSEFEKGNVALAMWLGVMLDGIPEALMMAFKSSEGSLEWEFIIAVCIANFPESFSGASLLIAQGFSVAKALSMWFGVFIAEVLLCMAIAAMIGDINPEDDSMFSMMVSAAEGLTGGAMLTVISTAMLPEALEGAGERSGLLFILGFGLSVFVSSLGPLNSGPPGAQLQLQ